jgi:hypothetical protein
MAQLYLGLPALTGKLDRYAERYNLVELCPVDTSLPNARKLARWREVVPPSFAFSVVLPRRVADLTPGAEADAALVEALDAARHLAARCLVLATPASVRPTKTNRDRIAALADRLPPDGHVRAWQPAGIWEPEDVMETAQRSNLLPVFDAAQEPLAPGPVVYTRIRALGHGMRLGADRLARIARQLADRRAAFVVVDRLIAQRVRSAVSSLANGDVHGVPAIFRPRGERLERDDLDEEQ